MWGLWQSHLEATSSQLPMFAFFTYLLSFLYPVPAPIPFTCWSTPNHPLTPAAAQSHLESNFFNSPTTTPVETSTSPKQSRLFWAEILQISCLWFVSMCVTGIICRFFFFYFDSLRCQSFILAELRRLLEKEHGIPLINYLLTPLKTMRIYPLWLDFISSKHPNS